MKKVELLFSELGNIYGEKYNMEYFRRCNPEIQVIETNHKEEPAFLGGDVDMVYMGCNTEKKQEMVLEALKPHKSKLKEMIDRGMVFLVTGNAVELFGNYIKDGERKIEGLGLFDFYSERYMNRDRHNSQFIGEFEGMKMLGHKSQFSFAYGDFNKPFISVEKGIGMNPETKNEGIHVNNFFATYSLGPFLIINPGFTKYLLRLLGLDDGLCFEKEIMEAYEYRLNELQRTIK